MCIFESKKPWGWSSGWSHKLCPRKFLLVQFRLLRFQKGSLILKFHISEFHCGMETVSGKRLTEKGSLHNMWGMILRIYGLVHPISTSMAKTWQGPCSSMQGAPRFRDWPIYFVPKRKDWNTKKKIQHEMGLVGHTSIHSLWGFLRVKFFVMTFDALLFSFSSDSWNWKIVKMKLFSKAQILIALRFIIFIRFILFILHLLAWGKTTELIWMISERKQIPNDKSFQK